MSKINTGGPAFPAQSNTSWYLGMGLRDWFAGNASEEDIKAALCEYPEKKCGTELDSRAWAKYHYADAMMAAIERSEE